jgi:hypothetical protein
MCLFPTLSQTLMRDARLDVARFARDQKWAMERLEEATYALAVENVSNEQEKVNLIDRSMFIQSACGWLMRYAWFVVSAAMFTAITVMFVLNPYENDPICDASSLLPWYFLAYDLMACGVYFRWCMGPYVPWSPTDHEMVERENAQRKYDEALKAEFTWLTLENQMKLAVEEKV